MDGDSILINFDSDRPIFQQIADVIEDAIISGAFPEESQIPSITELSVSFKINPATALKGINILVDDGILYKKRGVGMFVASGSQQKLLEKRKTQFFDSYVEAMLAEARRIGITYEEILDMVKKGFSK